MARSAARSNPLQESPPANLLEPSRPHPLALIGTAVLLGVGLVLWIMPLQSDTGGRWSLILAALAVVIGLIPAPRHALIRLLTRIRTPSPQASWRAAGTIAVCSGIYLFATAWWQGTALVPRVVDESSYLIQIRMLATGRLWMTPYPPDIRPFFDSFNILVQPKYGSMYFPGTALLYVPTAWFDLPFWAMPLLISAACVGLFYRLMVELIDGAYAAVAVLLLLGLTKFRALSVMLFSQTPMLFFGLLLMLAYLRWRKDRSPRWALVIGGLAGWAAITRPADALCYAVPIGVAMLLDLLQTTDRAKLAIPRTLLALLAAALPFLALQVVQNVGMTGNWWEFPEARYADESYPAPMLGFHHPDLSAATKRPLSPEKKALNEEMVDFLYETHQPSNIFSTWWNIRLPETLQFALPHALCVIFLPVGLLALRDRRRRTLAAVVLCFIAFYIFYVFYIPHYMIVIAPAMLMLVLLGFRTVGETVGRLWPRVSAAAALIVLLLPAALALGSLPELNSNVDDKEIFGTGFLHGEMELADERTTELAGQLPPGEQALVLFQFHPELQQAGEEPVYNTSTAWPDDAKVIRAHDRGFEQNKILFHYYAVVRRHPSMLVYLYDRATGVMTQLGVAGTLAEQESPATRPGL